MIDEGALCLRANGADELLEGVGGQRQRQPALDDAQILKQQNDLHKVKKKQTKWRE